MKKSIATLLLCGIVGISAPVMAEESPKILTLDNIQNGVYDDIALDDISKYAGFESAEWSDLWKVGNALILHEDTLIVMFTPINESGENLAVYVSPYDEGNEVYMDLMMGAVTKKEREGKSVSEDEFLVNGHKVTTYVYTIDKSTMKTDYCFNTGKSITDIVYQGDLLVEDTANRDAVFALIDSIKLPEK